MTKTILVTGSTDGIGLEAARTMYAQGHHVLLHGRNPTRLAAAEAALSELSGNGRVEGHLADLTDLADVEAFGRSIAKTHERLDVLVNNAGVFRSKDRFTSTGLDVRFAINTVAPFLLTRRLLPLLGPAARVVNLSSAAQSPVDLDALAGRSAVTDPFNAYAQSKLALTMWTYQMANSCSDGGPGFIAVNPGSLLATKMVREGFGMTGHDIRIGADIIVRAALSDEFAEASGLYFDNDMGRFASPHPDALDLAKCREVVRTIEAILRRENLSVDNDR